MSRPTEGAPRSEREGNRSDAYLTRAGVLLAHVLNETINANLALKIEDFLVETSPECRVQ